MVRELQRLRAFNGQQRVELGPRPLRQRLARLLGMA
jgi:hypothetical protein